MAYWTHLIDESVLRQIVRLLAAAQVRRRQNVRNRSETMEHHGGELNDQDQREEEHKHQTDGLQLQVLFADVDLRASRISEYDSCVLNEFGVQVILIAVL